MEKDQLIKELFKKLNLDFIPENKIEAICKLGSFWPHLNLAKIKCAFSNKDIISVYDESCPYPVWHRSLWIDNANPLSSIPNLEQEIFPQLFELFKKCPIPHKIGYGNENCEYTDDWFFSKDCYQCHSGANCQDLYYSYTCIRAIDSMSCIFSRDVSLSFDIINSNNCYESFYIINSHNINNSGFCFDCHNCENCLFSTNLRNKKFHIFNKQVSETEYLNFKNKLNIKNPEEYLKYIEKFKIFVKKEAFFKDQDLISTEDSSGNYLKEVKNCYDGFFLKGNEDCYFCVRSFDGKDKDHMLCVSNYESELCYLTSLVQINSYYVKYSSNLIKSTNSEYCFNCERIDYCFGCSGLVGKKYHIFNKEYSKNDYEILREKIISTMRKFNEYGNFFPDYFAPVKFAHSWSSLYFNKNENSNKITIPTKLEVDGIYKDSVSNLSFKISKNDELIANKIGAPLPYCHYVTRIKENIKWIPYHGELRESKCSVSGKQVFTNWGAEFDHRLISSEEYYKKFLT